MVSTILGAVAGGLGANAIAHRVEDRRKDRFKQQHTWESRYGPDDMSPHHDYAPSRSIDMVDRDRDRSRARDLDREWDRDTRDPRDRTPRDADPRDRDYDGVYDKEWDREHRRRPESTYDRDEPPPAMAREEPPQGGWKDQRNDRYYQDRY